MDESVTHLAGPVITISGRVIQRCAICGWKLNDSLNCAMPLKPDGTSHVFPTWRPGTLIRIISGNPTESIVLLDDGEHQVKLPDDSCVDLVEA